MTERDHPYEAEVEAERQAVMRAEAIPKIIAALMDARSALNRAPTSLRHAARFQQDITLMIDAIQGQGG